MLTPYGYLHEYDRDSQDTLPRLSLYLKACVLGPQPTANAKRYSFWVGGSRAISNTLEKTMKRSLRLGGGEIQYVWRFATYTDCQEWWTAFVPFSSHAEI